MSSEEQNLDRVRQILKRMERSIDDARDRRLRNGDDEPALNEPLRPATDAPEHRPHPAGPPTHNPAATKQASGPIRFDEDGRPIVGRAKPKNGNPSAQNNNPHASGPSWR